MNLRASSTNPLLSQWVTPHQPTAWTPPRAGTGAPLSQGSTGALRIKMHNKLPALVALGKYLGMFDERPQNTEQTGGSLMGMHATQSTLRRLREAGVGVAGYVGYPLGAPLPTLEQILDGAPPANSQPVRVDNIPGTRYVYSGGGYEIVQALIESKHFGSFDRALHELVFSRAGMRSSTFAQPLPIALMGRAARGHYADGRELAGGWRVVPELAAGGLWSTPIDLAKLLIEIVRAYRGEARQVISHAVAVDMLTRQNSGPYGLGGAIAGSGESLVLMKRGQNVGYQGYMLIFPGTGQGIVVLSNSDNGTELATAIIRRAAAVYRWPALGELAD